MIRIVMAAVVGAIVLLAWGMVSWNLLTWHDTSAGSLPDEARIVEALKETNTTSGTYLIPGPGHNPMAPERMQRHRQGPTGMLVYHTEGREPMAPMTIGRGAVINLIAALIAAMIVAASTGSVHSYIGRVAVVTMLGVFAAVTADGAYWNWLDFQNDWSMVTAVDRVIGWGMAGLFIAAIVPGPKPKKK